MHMYVLLLSHFSHVRLCVTPQTAAHQDTPSLGFSRQEHWSGLPFPSLMSESEITQSDPQRPHGLHPSRLLHPWDFPGKNAKVNLLIAAKLVNIIIYIYIYIYAIKYNIWTHIFYSTKVYFIPVNRIFMHLYHQFSAT